MALRTLSPAGRSRRRAVAAVGGLSALGALGAGLAGCAGAGAGAGRPQGAGRAAAAAPGDVVRLAPGVYAVPGARGAADAANLGRIGNAGFIVGERGVVAVDTGTSHDHGRALLAAIAGVTSLPVRAALVTHVRPEFVFGGSAFRERGIPVRMHVRSARLMKARCEGCLKTLHQVVGEEPMRGTVVYEPDETFDDSHVLESIGRTVRVIHLGHSSGPGDSAVLDADTGVLFAGGLLDAGRVPDVQDSDLPGWGRALSALRALGARTVVPGHGPASSPAVIDAVERYLADLQARARELVAGGSSLLDVGDAGELPQYAAWDQYDLIHRRNASIAYLRFERESMLGR